MQLSVIILNYNVRYFLEQCVLSVREAIKNLDAEIIVVDNNSADGSCAMMKARFPEVTLIENKENAGFPKGNNIGVAIAKGDYICILNPDTVVAEDTFEKVLAFARHTTDLGIVGVKLIDGTGNFLPESKRGIPTPWVAFTKIMGWYRFLPKSKMLGRYYAGHLDKDQIGKVEILVGAFMVLQRDLYLQLGGFDEKCFMYSDDIDLSYCALMAGKSNYYYPETTVIHYKGESTIKDSTYMKRFQEAMNFFYAKHFKVAPVFSFFMSMGILFFSAIKKFQGKPRPKRVPDRYVLRSENVILKAKLESILQKNVALDSSKIENNVFSHQGYGMGPVEIILDNNGMSFRSIIEVLENSQNPAATFKILPQHSAFIIGSNSSNDRGEVVVIGP